MAIILLQVRHLHYFILNPYHRLSMVQLNLAENPVSLIKMRPDKQELQSDCQTDSGTSSIAQICVK